MSLDGKCLFPLFHPTGPSPESARGEWSVGKAQGPGPRSEGCGERMEAWMLGTDNRKLLRTLSLFMAVFYFSYSFLVMSFSQNTELCFNNLSCCSPFQQALQAGRLWCTVSERPFSHCYRSPFPFLPALFCAALTFMLIPLICWFSEWYRTIWIRTPSV